MLIYKGFGKKNRFFVFPSSFLFIHANAFLKAMMEAITTKAI